MAKLYYYYGSMGSSKSMNLLMAAYNYEDQGKEVLVFTSGVDDRAGYNIIKSRAGASREALPVHKDTNIYETVLSYLEDGMDLYCVLMDEVQFYSERHILELTKVVDALNILQTCNSPTLIQTRVIECIALSNISCLKPFVKPIHALS